MSFLDLFKNKSTDVSVVEDDDKKNDSRAKIGAGVALQESIEKSTIAANRKYAKPDYNPQTRKQFYDNGSAHVKAKNRAFSGEGPVKDPYTGAELVKTKMEAKMRWGKDWQKHLAESDHIDPLHQIANRHKNDAWTTTEDIKNVANRDDNFQVMSRELNKNSSDVGKGGSTQEEWQRDSKRMEGVEKNIESGESIDQVKERIKDKGQIAEKGNDKLLKQDAFNNIKGEFHKAGVKGAQNAGVTAAAVSGVTNMVAVIKGEKTAEEAIVDTAKDGGKAAVTGYVMGGGMTVVSHTLSSSSSQVLKALSNSNVPAKVITAVIATGDTLKQWGAGEITTEECIIQLGEKGVNMATMGTAMAVGQALIPIPIVGGAIGALVGSMITSSMYNNMINKLKTKQLEHQERLRIIAESEAIAEQARAYRMELESYLDSYFKEYRACFDEALSSIELAFNSGDVDGVIAGANQITYKLDGQVKYNNMDEFKSYLDNDEEDVL